MVDLPNADELQRLRELCRLNKSGEWRSSQPDLNPERLVFLDETGAKTNMVRLYGRVPRGQRLFAPVPYGHAALRHDEITAPCVFDGPMNGASFLTYVEHLLAPVLQQGDIVVALSASL